MVVTNRGSSEKPDFRLHFPGVIPIQNKHFMQWFDDDSWRLGPLLPNDLIVLTDAHFGSPVTRPLRLSECQPAQGWKVFRQNKEAYLVICSDAALKKIPIENKAVTFDASKQTLESPSYVYRFKPSNHMLFDSIRLKQKGGKVIEIAKDADLLIRADVKRFFSMQFDSSNIESRMKQHRIENFGALATLGFYLKVLFFKISLNLETDVQFFSNAAHIPMVLTIPVNAKDKLHPKSGVLYSFALGSSAKETHVEMPRLLDNPFSPKDGLTYCEEDSCRYRLKFESELEPDKEFALELHLPKTLVEYGMFPQFVSDVGDAAPGMNWSIPSSKRGVRRVGLYLEVSGLPQGEHPWDFWMELGSKQATLSHPLRR